MITTPATTTPSTNQLSSPKSTLNTSDFIQMMITQLQNQDPLDPEKSQDLLQQMSQIGQLQSATMMQTSISQVMLQSQIGAAGNLIGKTVKGLDDQKNNVTGVVNSVRIAGNSVSLELDNGKTLGLGNVTDIMPTTGAAAAGATGATTPVATASK